MKNIKLIYLLILLCCTICKIDAQPPHTFTQYKTSDGLYQKTIMHILQDKNSIYKQLLLNILQTISLKYGRNI